MRTTEWRQPFRKNHNSRHFLRPKVEPLEERKLLTAITFVAQNLTSAGETNSPRAVQVADLDGDGDQDVLSASANDDKIAWYENLDGKGQFGPQQVITDQLDVSRVVLVMDVDDDGDVDVLAAGESQIAWFENTNGRADFADAKVVMTAPRFSGVQSISTGDLDGDGDVDVLAAMEISRDDTLVWLENVDGRGSFADPKVVGEGSFTAQTTDLDGDGDLDVLTAVSDANAVAWYENLDGIGTFGSQRRITVETQDPSSVFAADVDGDGDQDVLSASTADDKIAWYENIDGSGSFGPQQVITTQAAGWPVWNNSRVYAADLDADGDIDVLSASAADNKIAWYENVDAKGAFGAQQVITNQAQGANAVIVEDLDADGDLDVLSTSHFGGHVTWYEHRLAGDANDDGKVAFADFLKLAKNFETEKAVWEDGDFNGDGIVGFDDFLILADNFGLSRQEGIARPG